MNDNKQKYFNDSINVSNSVTDNLGDVVTIYSKDLKGEFSEDDYSYKVTSDGKILFNNIINNVNTNYFREKYSKDLMIEELIKFGFQKIPESLTEEDIEFILQFSISKIDKNITFGKIYPCKITKDETGNLNIILLMYNGNTIAVALEKLPFKLKDAFNKVIAFGEINFDKTIDSKRIGIFNINISKEELLEEHMDLTSWSISFER